MSQTASGRYRIDLAPGGLALVQELLNTIPAGRPAQPDLLATLEHAQRWLDTAVSVWAERTGAAPPSAFDLTDRDLVKLRTLRDRLRAQAGASPGDPALNVPETAGSLRLTLTGDGKIVACPRGQGAEWVSSAVLGEAYLAQQHNLWHRLKICRNEQCGTAFYDRSRNNSGVWHDVHVCGNAINLRASRARRKQAVHEP